MQSYDAYKAQQKYHSIRAENCHGCHWPLTKLEMALGFWWCSRCKDPEGFISRLSTAQRTSKKQCAEQYSRLMNAEQLPLVEGDT